MSNISSTSAKLSQNVVKKKREEIERRYREAIIRAEATKERALKALQKVCPHTNSESGEGGSLDYWFECLDCGKN